MANSLTTATKQYTHYWVYRSKTAVDYFTQCRMLYVTVIGRNCRLILGA